MKTKLHRPTLEAVVAYLDRKIASCENDQETCRLAALRDPLRSESPHWKSWNRVGSELFLYKSIKRDILEL